MGIIDDIKKAGRSLVRKDVLTAPFVAEMKSTTANMYRCLLYTSPSPRDRG